MLFSSLLRAISADIRLETVRICDMYDIKDSALIDGLEEDFQNDVLYIGYYRQIALDRLPPHAVLVRGEAAPLPPSSGCDLALVGEKELFRFFNAAKALLDASRTRGIYAELMDCAAQTKSVSACVNLAASKLGNSVVLLDTDFKVLACSNVYPIDDPVWEQNIRQGYCGYDFISAVNEMDIIKNSPKTSEPIVVTCSASPLRKLTSKILRGGQVIGFVIMLENENALSPSHFEMLPTVSAAAGDILVKFAPYLLPDSTHYQRLIYELAIGAPPEKLAPHIAKLSFPENMCALRLCQTRDRGQQHLREQVAEKLKALLPGTSFAFHESGIAALLTSGDAAGATEDQLERLESLAKSELLRIGVSRVFSGIEDFAARYAEAGRALELESRFGGDRPVCLYTDYSFFDLLEKAGENGPLAAFCHPALAQLRKYDGENGTELRHTLDVFLSCGCNIKLASEKLFIHRNSLAYRLRRIFEITRIDPEDNSVRFLLDMSFRIEHYSDSKLN